MMYLKVMEDAHQSAEAIRNKYRTDEEVGSRDGYTYIVSDKKESNLYRKDADKIAGRGSYRKQTDEINEDIVITKLSNAEGFVKIDVGNNTHYYGGNQLWYPYKIGRKGGCGPTAASNITAYLAINNKEFENLYTGSDVTNIKMEDFIKHMEEIYKYITPIEIPDSIAGEWEIISPFTDQPNKLEVPITAGVPFSSEFAEGVEAFARSKGVYLEAKVYNSYDSTFPGIKYGLPNSRQALEFMKEGLKKNSPVALLMVKPFNEKLSELEYTKVGEKRVGSSTLHWVTVTSVTENKKTGNVNVEVSTWGGKATIDFKDAWKDLRGYSSLIYFD